MKAIPTLTITIIGALMIAIAVITGNAQAQPLAPAKYVEGEHYQLVNSPTKTSQDGTIEVTEVFWYGCPHCNQFQPVFDSWKKQQASDVVVKHSPAMWSKPMIVHAHMFYTAQALGIFDEAHRDIFDAMHVEKKKLVSPKQIFTLFEKHGVSQADFDKTFDSFGVKSQVQQARARAKAYGVTGTPEVVINGKYRISGRMVSSQREVLKVASFLIAKERAASKS